MKTVIVHQIVFSLCCMCLWAMESVAGSVNTGKIIIDGVEMSSGGINSRVIHGNGQQKTESRRLKTFASITISTAVDLEYQPGVDSKLEITANSNLLPFLKTEVRGGELIISSSRSFSSSDPIRVVAMSPMIAKLNIMGASDVRLNSLRSEDLVVDLSGSGDVFARGTVRNLSVSVTGNGDINLKSLKAENVNIVLHGAADIEVTASRSLSINLAGAGDVVYYGSPATVKKHISGVGDVVSGD